MFDGRDDSTVGFYPGIHYPTDVLAGYLAAPLWVGTIALSYLLWRVVRGPEPERRGVEIYSLGW